MLAGFFIILSCLGLLCFVLYSLINKGFIQVFDLISLSEQVQWISLFAFRICLIVAVCLGILVIIFLVFQRMKKLKYLSSLMEVTKIVLLSNFPMLPCFILFIMSGISIVLWYCFTKLIWNCVKMSMS
jgi:hypothetical protein